MKSVLFSLLLLLTLLAFPRHSKETDECLYVILKMDDLRANSNSTYNSSWQRLVDSVRSYNVKAALGPVLIDLTTGSQAYKDSLAKWHNSDEFEIWHHGWTHTRNDYPPNYNNSGEFSGPTHEYQKERLEWGMDAAREELGITIRTFGAPYNQTDAVFADVIRENPDIKVWLYGNDSSYPNMSLFRGSNNQLESSTGVVSYESFLLAFESNTNPYLVLQGHPGQWNTNSFEEFDQVIKYLKTQNVCFILPYDYYLQEVNNPLVYQNNFEDADSLYISAPLDKVNADQTCCGELKISIKDGLTLSASEPIIHPIQINGAENTVDIGETLTLYTRIRATNSFDLRIDLSDGTNATDGANGKISRTIPAGLDEWTQLVYTYTLTSYEEVNLATNAISELHLYPGDFDGTLYIDYLSIGAPAEDSAICRSDIDRDGCVLMFEDQFDDEKVNLSGDALGMLDTLESGCGELVIGLKDGADYPAGTFFSYEFPSPVDFTQNPLVQVRLRSSGGMDMRIDLSDGTNATNGSNGKITNAVPSNSYTWKVLDFNYPQIAFEEQSIDSTSIKQLNIYLDPNEPGFSGTLYIDYLSAGKASNIGNAIGRTEQDSCGMEEQIIIDDSTEVLSTVSKDVQIMLYPNPADNYVFLKNFGSLGSNLKIVDLSGKTVLNEELLSAREDTAIKVDISNLKPGIYMVLIQSSEQHLIKRLVKI